MRALARSSHALCALALAIGFAVMGLHRAAAQGSPDPERPASVAPDGGPGGVDRSADETFRHAGLEYEAGRYARAAELYQSLLDRGFDDIRVHYNLGNSRFKAGELGRAILAWERVLARNPHDSDARENLEYATLLTVDKVGPEEDTFPETVARAARRGFGPDRAMAVFLASLLASSCLALPAWGMARGRGRRILTACAGAAFAAALLAGLAGLAHVVAPGGHEHAVILASSVDGLSAPATDGTVLFTVHEGLKVEVRAGRPGWIQIALPNGLVGWIEESRAERI